MSNLASPTWRLPFFSRRVPHLAAICGLLAACQLPRPGGDSPASASPPAIESQPSAVTTPAGFNDSIVLSGRDKPTLARFAANGRIFVAEKTGRIYFYDSLTDTTPTLFADLRDKVNSLLDRGLSGIALDPNYPTTPNVYVLYTHDDATNPENGQSIANRNATDACPSPPGYNVDGCVSNGRLSRLVDTGTYPITNETVLVDEWPQQFPGHSVQHLTFGPDGYLYASAGDGALHNTTDTGKWGIPVNPLNDPVDSGGSLRAQSLRRPAGQNVVLNGALIRIDKNTGLAAPTNPNINHADPEARRILAFGFRNPFRFTFHPTTGDVWVGDVGAKEYDEIDRVPLAAPVDNFGWPCYEGPNRQPGFDGLDLPMCESLYSSGPVVAPVFSVKFNTKVFPGDTCTTIGNTAISGLAFYQSGNYPTQYQGALFFSDYSRSCIWYMLKGADGQPNPATVANFAVGATSAVDLQVGPGGDLFYVDHTGGALHRIRYQAPTANVTSDVTVGEPPLTVHFSGATSTKVNSTDTLTYAWDLDGDGQFDDSTLVAPSYTYETQGSTNVRLKVTDQAARSDISNGLVILVGTAPVAVIDAPSIDTTFVANQNITFSGHALDAEDGPLPASALSWELLLEHCPADCHSHSVLTWDGVAGGSFPAPDHEYPSHLRLVMKATDSTGLVTIATQDIQPQTVDLTFTSTPATSPGLQLGFNFESAVTPFTRTVIIGSTITVSASSQTVGQLSYGWQSWSDGGAVSHSLVAPAVAATYTANFVGTPWTSQDINALAPAGSWSEAGGVHTIVGGGADIWGTSDSFRFTYQPISGDATITARVTSLANTNTFAKAGVMFRQNLNANSINVHALISPVTGSGYRFTKRTTAGGTSTSEVVTPSPLPDAPGWVRVVRAGNVFTAYSSANGTTFTQVGTPQTIAMGNPIYVGMAVTSHVNGTSTTAKFDNVTVTTPMPLPPGAPTGLTATAGNAQVALAWTAVSGATSYTVKRGLSAGGPYTDFTQANVTGTTFTNTGLANGTTYYYVVNASNAAGAGANSAEKSATPQLPPPPGAPTGLTATAGNAQVVLAWTASSGATSYTVKRGLVAGGPYTDFTQANVTGTTFTNTGLVNGTTYFYVVSASNAVGEGANSAEKSATPQLPPPPAAPTGLTATAGNAQVVLAWTASSGATSYTVKRSLTAGGPYTDFVQANVTAVTFTNTGLANGTTYFYVVSASSVNGESASSAEKSATPALPSTPISNLVVRDTATTNPPAGTDGIANSAQWSIQTNFANNVVAFGDRTVKVTTVPTAANGLLGKSWIRTAADSKNYAGTPLATFTVGGTFVFLAIDNRHNGTGTKPAWLDATWIDQGYDLTITEGTTARPYSVYRKPVTAGSSVTLPTINSTTAPCYIVIVQ
jgi:glucose/arabinose dehydrogenase